MSTPDWLVDPEAPTVPADDPDEPFEAPEVHENGYALVQPPELRQARAVARLALAEAHLFKTRHLISVRRARRLAALAQRPVPSPSAPHPAPRKGGHPGHRVRNDRLLTLYEATDAHLSRLKRCRLAAAAYAAEVARAAGRDPAREYVMPQATARDAIAEARRRRAVAA